MAGYHEFSKSNNALAAEADGKFPASVLAKMLRVRPGAIKALLHTSEWHHTSKHYNCTNYYSEESALEILEQLQAWRPADKNEQVFEGCSGSFLTWSGTRNHPHATVNTFKNTRAVKKGAWFTLHLDGGSKPVRKGETTRGFHLRDTNGKSLTFNRD